MGSAHGSKLVPDVGLKTKEKKVANAINPTTNTTSTPYLTIQEFKDAPTGIDIDNLIYNNIDPEAQDKELANVISRASSWIDTYCNQTLGATLETETQRTRVTGNGSIIFHPRYSPIVSLNSLQYGTDPSNLYSVSDCSVCWLENEQVIFPSPMAGTMTNQGPLQFGYPGITGALTFLKYSYVSGYANTLLAEEAIIGEFAITVERAMGIIVGQELTIYDGLYTERVIVADDWDGSTTIALKDPLVYDHNPGVSVSTLPAAIKQAAILVTTAFLKVRGDNSLVMGVGTQPSQISPGSQAIGEEIVMAQDLLKPYRRIR